LVTFKRNEFNELALVGVVQNDNGELEAGGVLAKFPILKEESSEIYFEWKNLK